jgi:hypothetical protein
VDEKSLIMKELTLTQDEIKALLFCGGRYSCGSTLLDDLIAEWQSQNPTMDYDQALEGFTVYLSLDSQKELGEALREDTENGKTSHPLLARSLTSKLWQAAYFEVE